MPRFDDYEDEPVYVYLSPEVQRRGVLSFLAALGTSAGLGALAGNETGNAGLGAVVGGVAGLVSGFITREIVITTSSDYRAAVRDAEENLLYDLYSPGDITTSGGPEYQGPRLDLRPRSNPN